MRKITHKTATWDAQSLLRIMRHKYETKKNGSKKKERTHQLVLYAARAHAFAFTFRINISKATESFNFFIPFVSSFYHKF